MPFAAFIAADASLFASADDIIFAIFLAADVSC